MDSRELAAVALAGLGGYVAYRIVAAHQLTGGQIEQTGLRPQPSPGTGSGGREQRLQEARQALLAFVGDMNMYAITKRREYYNAAYPYLKKLLQYKDLRLFDVLNEPLVDRLKGRYEVAVGARKWSSYHHGRGWEAVVTVNDKKEGKVWRTKEVGWNVYDPLGTAVTAFWPVNINYSYVTIKNTNRSLPQLAAAITELAEGIPQGVPIEWAILPTYTCVAGFIEPVGWHGHGYMPPYRSGAPGFVFDLDWARIWLQFGYLPGPGKGGKTSVSMTGTLGGIETPLVCAKKKISAAARQEILSQLDEKKWFFQVLGKGLNPIDRDLIKRELEKYPYSKIKAWAEWYDRNGGRNRKVWPDDAPYILKKGGWTVKRALEAAVREAHSTAIQKFKEQLLRYILFNYYRL